MAVGRWPSVNSDETESEEAELARNPSGDNLTHGGQVAREKAVGSTDGLELRIDQILSLHFCGDIEGPRTLLHKR